MVQRDPRDSPDSPDNRASADQKETGVSKGRLERLVGKVSRVQLAAKEAWVSRDCKDLGERPATQARPETVD